MSTPQATGVALRALEFGGLPAHCVVQWADRAIVAEPAPPQWLLDVALLDSTRFTEMLSMLREHAEGVESREVDVCLLAHLFFTDQVSIGDLFQRGFRACISAYDTPMTSSFERLADVLSDWDQMGLQDLNQGDWRQRVTVALLDCQRSCRELSEFIRELYESQANAV